MDKHKIGEPMKFLNKIRRLEKDDGTPKSNVNHYEVTREFRFYIDNIPAINKWGSVCSAVCFGVRPSLNDIILRLTNNMFPLPEDAIILFKHGEIYKPYCDKLPRDEHDDEIHIVITRSFVPSDVVNFE